MATKQTNKQAKTKAEVRVDRSANNRPIATSEHEPQHPNRRARSRSGAARTDRAGATAAAAKASLNGSEVIHNPEKAPSYSKPLAEQADLATANVSGAEQPQATTKRAQLIGLLERPEGATVAEIGQRLGWLPHTVRAAITGLRKAGREVTRSEAGMPMTGPCTGSLLSKLPASGDRLGRVDRPVSLGRRSRASRR